MDCTVEHTQSNLLPRMRNRYGRSMADENARGPLGGGAELEQTLAPAAGEPARALRIQQSWAAAPATYLLLGVNVLVFLGMTFSGVSPVAPRPDQLLHWGAEYGPAVLLLDQWWRLATAMFVHVGALHIGLNMWCLWNLGLLGEPLLGAPGLVAVYLLTGFAGNLLSLATHPGIGLHAGAGAVGAGASGAIFGIAGVLVVLLGSPLLPLAPADRKQLRRNVIGFAVFNFVLGFGFDAARFSAQVDNAAHLGGFLAGLLLALPMVPRAGAPLDQFRRRRNLAVMGEALLLLLLCVGVRAFFLPAAGS